MRDTNESLLQNLEKHDMELVLATDQQNPGPLCSRLFFETMINAILARHIETRAQERFTRINKYNRFFKTKTGTNSGDALSLH